MSAVMSTLSIISGGRRGHRKLSHTKHDGNRRSGQFSDAGEDLRSSKNDLKQQRSASLQTLEKSGISAADLDNLEAKMASIEMSLGASRHRSSLCSRENSIRELDALRTALQDKDSLIMSLKKQLSASLSAARLAVQSSSPNKQNHDHPNYLSPEDRKALEERAAAVRQDLENRKTNIQELRRRLERTHVTDNIDTRIQQAELQYQVGREELELLSLTEQARALQQLIEHANATHHAGIYGIVREYGGSAIVVSVETREGTWAATPRALGLFVEWTRDCPHVRAGDRVLEVNGISMVTCRSQEEVQRAIGVSTPIRLVVLRGHNQQTQLVAGLTQNEVTSLKVELGSLRSAADDAEKAKEYLRSDNTRLTHRISYLEEQVAELLARHPQLQPTNGNDSHIVVNKSKKNVTNISITSDTVNCKSSPKSEVQVFQKGPDITAIVAKLPGLEGGESSLPVMRPRSNASGASTRLAMSPRESPAPKHRSHSSHSCDPKANRMRHSLSHHCIGSKDYNTETDAAIRMIERNQRHIEKQRQQRLSRCISDDQFKSDSDIEQKDTSITQDRHNEIKIATERIEESIKKTNWAERKTMSLIEQLKRSQKMRKIKKNESAEDINVETERNKFNRMDGKVLENSHKNRRTSRLYSRSAKSSEIESEYSDYPNSDLYFSSPRIDYGSESGTRSNHYRKNEDRRPDGEATRPTPPRKPMRLSLHKARSAHSLLSDAEKSFDRPPSEAKSNGDLTPMKKPIKRTYACDKTRDKTRETGRSTPRPSRKILNGLSTCDTPAADDLYPHNTHSPVKMNGRTISEKWC